MTVYCAGCNCVKTGPGMCDCGSDDEPIVDEGFDTVVDRLMFQHGLDRDEAEARALAILEDDAA